MEPTMEMDHVQMGACDLLQLQQLLVPCVLRYGVADSWM